MAKETTTTKKPTATKTTTKEKEVVSVEEVIETKDNKNENNTSVDPTEQMMQMFQQQLFEMQRKLDESLKANAILQAAQNIPPQIIVQSEKTMSSKKVKCLNLLHGILSVSTEPNGGGRPYVFESYGEQKMIKYDDVAEIASAYPYTVEKGLFYIADREVLSSLGIESNYEEVYTKELLDKIIYLREESDVDLLLTAEPNLRAELFKEVAKLINANEVIDYNYIRRIRKEAKVDLEELAEKIKMADPTVSVEEKAQMDNVVVGI
jgi:DNA-binding transcriptional regulator YiaG